MRFAGRSMSGGNLVGVGIGTGIGATGGTEAIAIGTATVTEIGARGRDPVAIVPGLARGIGSGRIEVGVEVHAVEAEAEAAIARTSSSGHCSIGHRRERWRGYTQLGFCIIFVELGASCPSLSFFKTCDIL